MFLKYWKISAWWTKSLFDAVYQLKRQTTLYNNLPKIVLHIVRVRRPTL